MKKPKKNKKMPSKPELCECKHNALGCRAVCPQDKDMRCSRKRNHWGEHFACTVAQHKVYVWKDDVDE